LYIKAGLKLPPHKFYEEYAQLENGVGMMRSFIAEFMDALKRMSRSLNIQHSTLNIELPDALKRMSRSLSTQHSTLNIELPDALKRMSSRKIMHRKTEFTVATGMAASKYLTKLLKITSEKCGKINAAVRAIRNEFFGDTVTVSGLVTGGDIIKQLRGCELGSRLLIPRNMLRHGDGVFLDDVTVAEVSEVLGVTVRVVEQDGADFLRAVLGN
jgi:NifB/MoaA-like Fe-S oxidoreductase